MKNSRKVIHTSQAIPTIEGAGVHLNRALGFHEPERYDPFLLLDDFRTDTPAHYLKGFPWHPHRGIETITYVLNGDVEHGDSIGNRGIISGGDVQWMTAGSGIIHQEMPKGDGNGSMHGFQLWLNLPSSEKMCRPQYRNISRTEIPEVLTAGGGVLIRIICGELSGTRGPVSGITTDPQFFDITLQPGMSYTLPTRSGYTAMAYVIHGSGCFEPENSDVSPDKTLLFFSDGSQLEAEAGPQGMRFLFFSGRPLGEPIAWRGPIVMTLKRSSFWRLMNTSRELSSNTVNLTIRLTHLPVITFSLEARHR